MVRVLRETHPHAVRIFTQGGCFQLFHLLSLAIPDTAPFYDPIEGHVYTHICEDYYVDILGIHQRTNLVPLYEAISTSAQPTKWAKEAFWERYT